MKKILIFILLCILAIPAFGQNYNPNYDSTLAQSFSADDYGMKWYVLVILKTGSTSIEDKKTRDSLFAGHLNNITRLADLGKLIVAGPFGRNDNSFRGIFILNVESFEEAEELLQTDPTIKEKLLEAELYKWYGSAALPAYLKTHKKIEKIKIK